MAPSCVPQKSAYIFVNALSTFYFSLDCELGEGDGSPLQYSCLESPMGGGAWWAAVYGVAQSRTQLKRLSSSSSSSRLWAPGKQGQLCLIHLYVLLQSCSIVGPQWILLMLVNIFKSIWWYLWGPRQKRVLQRETSVKLSLSWVLSMDPLL